MRDINHIYVHIPYCDKICFYCDFVKQLIPRNRKDILKYLFLIKQELQQYSLNKDNVKTIYIGGGTPSALDENELEFMLNIFNEFKVSEFTIEANPESLNRAKLEIIKRCGVNRLSIGIQTFNNKLLKNIGRVHNKEKAIEVYNLAREIGFDNISIDLIYNLPSQNEKDIFTDIDYIKQLKPDHISWYSLIVKEDSIWGKRNLKKPDNDEYFDSIINNELDKLKYKRYEVSNYSFNNKKSLHNLAYWETKQFIGLGLGAHGYELKDESYFITKNVGTALNYCKQFQKIEKKDHYFNKIMMGLRLKDGINLGEDVLKYYKDIIKECIKKNILSLEENVLRCTDESYNILNDVLINFLD